MMIWVIYVVYNGQFTRMDQLFKLLKWLQILQDFLWKSEDPGGYELFSFFCTHVKLSFSKPQKCTNDSLQYISKSLTSN